MCLAVAKLVRDDCVSSGGPCDKKKKKKTKNLCLETCPAITRMGTILPDGLMEGEGLLGLGFPIDWTGLHGLRTCLKFMFRSRA